jgi:hypothetical protein
MATRRLRGFMVRGNGTDTRLRKRGAAPAALGNRSAETIRWTWTSEGLRLLLNGRPTTPRTVESKLRDMIRCRLLDDLLAKPDQGKVFSVTAAAAASNHFMRTGTFTRFADWRFVHRARLNVLPLNGAPWIPHGYKRCRRCGAENETLPHVLDHCNSHANAIQRRHDAILRRLTAAVEPPQNGEIRLNQRVPGLSDAVRPDLVVVDETTKRATIIDVTVPFENRTAAFNVARLEKQRKYAAAAQHLRSRGYDVFCDAFIVGTLGGFDPRNVDTFLRLGIDRRASARLSRLVVSDTIRWSRDIYVEHVTGERQYAANQDPTDN